jgi:putative endonuclease
MGESVAEKFLRKNGFVILERNYWKKWGEIDIIAQKDNAIRFVEVKTVSRENLEERVGEHRPEDNLHPRKFERMARTIESYLIEHDIQKDWQIDVITVRLDIKSKRAKVDFLENIIL